LTLFEIGIQNEPNGFSKKPCAKSLPGVRPWVGEEVVA
jgi:hypothetical protein